MGKQQQPTKTKSQPKKPDRVTKTLPIPTASRLAPQTKKTIDSMKNVGYNVTGAYRKDGADSTVYSFKKGKKK